MHTLPVDPQACVDADVVLVGALPMPLIEFPLPKIRLATCVELHPFAVTQTVGKLTCHEDVSLIGLCQMSKCTFVDVVKVRGE